MSTVNVEVKAIVIVDTRTNALVPVKNRIVAPTAGGLVNSFMTTGNMSTARNIELANRLEISEEKAAYCRNHWGRIRYKMMRNEALTDEEQYVADNMTTIKESDGIRFCDQTTFVKKKVVGLILED
ncbi:MAG: hypothetical protein ACRC3J_05175 [Culicoidibacterales bacterium]